MSAVPAIPIEGSAASGHLSSGESGAPAPAHSPKHAPKHGPVTLSAWRFIWRLIVFGRWQFPLAVAGGIGTFGMPLAAGLVMRLFFDALTGDAPAGLNVETAIAFFALQAIADTLANNALSFGWISFRDTSMALLRRNATRAVLYAYGGLGLPDSSGEAIGRLRDDVTEIVESVDAWIDMIGRTIFVVAALWVMLRIDPRITLVVLAPMTVIVTLLNLLESRIKEYRRRTREAGSRVTGFLGEIFGGVGAITAASAAPHVVAHLRRLGEARRRSSLRDHFLNEMLEAFNWNVVNLGTGVILLLAAQAMRGGRFSVGDFALFVIYLDQVVYFPLEIARLVTTYRQAWVSQDRLAALVPSGDHASLVSPEALRLTGPLPSPARDDGRTYSAESGSAAKTEDSLQRLEVRDLTYRHPGSGRGIGPIDLALERGSFTVITGRIGAGKSTLLRVLLGLLPMDSGEIWWNGHRVDPASGFFVPPRAAYVPQSPRLFSETLRENILAGLIGTSVDREANLNVGRAVGMAAGVTSGPVSRLDNGPGMDGGALARALHIAVLEPDILALEQGLETLVGPRGVRLSGGQVQRAATARALVRTPELLVIDDLSSALDVETERTLWDHLLSSSNGDQQPTILAVSHRPIALDRADRVIVLEDGVVVRLHTSLQRGVAP
jgi:ATP-binding cassette, subfamily B, bacterial